MYGIIIEFVGYRSSWASSWAHGGLADHQHHHIATIQNHDGEQVHLTEPYACWKGLERPITL